MRSMTRMAMSQRVEPRERRLVKDSWPAGEGGGGEGGREGGRGVRNGGRLPVGTVGGREGGREGGRAYLVYR